MNIKQKRTTLNVLHHTCLNLDDCLNIVVLSMDFTRPPLASSPVSVIW